MPVTGEAARHQTTLWWRIPRANGSPSWETYHQKGGKDFSETKRYKEIVVKEAFESVDTVPQGVIERSAL